MSNEPLKTNPTPNNLLNDNNKLTFKYPIPYVNTIYLGKERQL